MSHTRLLAEWIHDLRYENIPDECIIKAKEQIYSVLGAILMSVDEKPTRSVINSILDYDRNGTSTIFGCQHKTSPGNAAIANSFAAQLFEFEDWVFASHAGASVIPTSFSVGEAVGVAGKELLTAIVIGNELAGRTGRAILNGAYVGNSLPNHQVDTAFVAGRLFGLETTALQHAVGLSCFMAMESCPAGYLTDAKGLINSYPAYVGIMSAQMARNGLVGNKDIIEHPAGYLWTVSEEVDLNQLTDNLGTDWVMPTLRSKVFPICGYNIAAIDAALQLTQQHGVKPEDIDKVTVYAPASTLFAGTRFHSLVPDVYEQIRCGTATHMPLLFDVPFPMAAAIIDGELTPKQYDSQHIADPKIHELASRISLKVDNELNEAYYKKFQFGSRVEMLLKSGNRIELTVSEMPGAPSNPFDVKKKFMRGAEPVLGKKQALQAAELIGSLESMDVQELCDALRPSQ